MTVTSPRSIRADQARATLVAVLAIAQTAVAALGGIGGSIGAVADEYRTPVLAADWAFAIWGPIYLGFLAYACYQCLPGQRHRALHRRTGWWLAASAVFNMGWVASWSAGLVPLAELLIIGLMVSMAVVFGRLSRESATGGTERLVFRTPVALYTGWVSVALVMGTAATGVWAGLPGTTAIAAAASIIVLIGFTAIVSWVIVNGTAVVGYTAAVVWALAGVVFGGAPAPVAVTAVLVAVVAVAAAARRVVSAAGRARAAFG